ncbi:MAG TPA: PilZ domain-containing protein [Stellaceae bacterium]|nr:PilZ domain-containing protein [Stellaceae bacterium]
METHRTWIDRAELRRDRRYLMPGLDVKIGEGQYHAINWSMGGLLIDGVCHDIGSRVRGCFGLTGSREPMPFAATVVRIDPEYGSCAICFDDPSVEHLEGLAENPFGEQLH